MVGLVTPGPGSVLQDMIHELFAWSTADVCRESLVVRTARKLWTEPGRFWWRERWVGWCCLIAWCWYDIWIDLMEDGFYGKKGEGCCAMLSLWSRRFVIEISFLETPVPLLWYQRNNSCSEDALMALQCCLPRPKQRSKRKRSIHSRTLWEDSLRFTAFSNGGNFWYAETRRFQNLKVWLKTQDLYSHILVAGTVAAWPSIAKGVLKYIETIVSWMAGCGCTLGNVGKAHARLRSASRATTAPTSREALDVEPWAALTGLETRDVLFGKGLERQWHLATRPTTSPEKQSDDCRNSCRFWDILDTFCQRFVPFAIRIEAGSQWIAFLSLRRRWLETEAFHVPG